MAHCHCATCRKAHGTAFATYISADPSSFRMAGAELVASFVTADGARRAFCSRCGSVVPDRALAHDECLLVPAGNLETDPQIRPEAHWFAASRAPWFDVDAELRDEQTPAIAGHGAVPAPVHDAAPGRPRGSCLCGASAYVLEAPPIAVRNCHCTRCRRARSAAHASNLATTLDGVRYTRGEDLLTSYKLPEARFFTQVFCRDCGSPMPRKDRDRGIAIVPMGGFDDEPGATPQVHIYVAYKAPWYEIRDRLPQQAEYTPIA